MKKLLICFLLLSGCTTVVQDPVKEVEKDIILKKDTLVIIDSTLLEYCPNLPKLTKQAYTQQEALNVLKDWVYRYKLCQKKHALLSDWAKKASGMDNVNK